MAARAVWTTCLSLTPAAALAQARWPLPAFYGGCEAPRATSARHSPVGWAGCDHSHEPVALALQNSLRGPWAASRAALLLARLACLLPGAARSWQEAKREPAGTFRVSRQKTRLVHCRKRPFPGRNSSLQGAHPPCKAACQELSLPARESLSCREVLHVMEINECPAHRSRTVIRMLLEIAPIFLV